MRSGHPGIKVVLEDDGRGSRIEHGLPLPPVALVDGETALRFTTGQPFVLEHDGETGPGLEGCAQRFDHAGHVGRRPVEAPRQAEHDQSDAILLAGQTPHLVAHRRQPGLRASRGMQHRHGTRERARGITDGDADPPRAIVESDHSHRLTILAAVTLGRRPRLTATAGLAVCVALGTAPAFAAIQNPSRPETLDRRIAARIRALEDDADRIAAQARAVVEAIRALEAERDRHIADAERAKRDLRSAEVDLAVARQRLEKLRQVEAMDEPLIAARLVQVYKQGHGGYIRLLLGAETLQDVGRAARTISTLVEQNAARVTARLEEIAAASRAVDDLAARVLDLHDAGMRADEAGTAAAAAIAERETAAAQLDRRRDANAVMLGELRAAQTGGAAVAAPAGAAASSAAASGGSGSGTPAGRTAPFAAFRGALDWPVVGPVATRFGSGRRQASGFANGVTIAAPPGTPVVAIHAGVVTYAEPLAGFGTMVMLDHGGGFSSAYGLLRSTVTRRDQRVVEGEQIGVVGDAATAGARTALYFEVRAAGRPADPLQWLRPR